MMEHTITASEEILLSIAHPDLYRLNIFRITELPVDAETRDISRRQAMIKQARDIALPLPAGYGRAMPLRKEPDPDQLSEAFQHLGVPERRLIDEIFWFWPRQFGMSRNDEVFAALVRGEIGQVAKLWRQQQGMPGNAGNALHNLAVLNHTLALEWENTALTRALTQQEQQERDACWEEAFKSWCALLESEAFWSQVTARIRALDDPRLTTGMVRRIRDCLPLTLLSINARLAVSAAEKNDLKECKRQQWLLRNSGFTQQTADEAMHAAVEPLRERVKTLCKMADNQALADPKKAHGVASKLLDQSAPLLKVLDALLPKNDATRDGIHDEIALIAMLAVVSYGNQTDDWSEVIPIVERIHPLAMGELLRERIMTNLTTSRSNQIFLQCWYCQRRRADKNAAYSAHMYGDVTRSYYVGRTRVEWRKLAVPVNRCQACQKLHSKAQMFKTLGMLLGVLLAIVLGVLALGAFSTPADSSSTSSNFLVGILFWLGLAWFLGWLGLALGRELDTSVFLSPQGVRAEQDVSEFPPVARLLKEKWKFGDKP